MILYYSFIIINHYSLAAGYILQAFAEVPPHPGDDTYATYMMEQLTTIINLFSLALPQKNVEP